MLKYRLIPVLFLKHGFLVRSESFSVHQNLGNPVAQVERYNAWNVDELIYIDITPDESYDYQREDTGLKNPKSILDVIDIVSQKCFMPLTFGGKIRTLEDIRLRLNRGADKVTINTAALARPEFVREAAAEFGSQAVVVSIDALKKPDGTHEVYSCRGTKPTGLHPTDWAVQAESLGAGEIFLNSIDRDGMATGYDLELVKGVTNATKIPVIACGGVGSYKDFVAGIVEGGASAVAAGNIFNFKEMSYVLAKKELKKHQMNVR